MIAILPRSALVGAIVVACAGSTPITPPASAVDGPAESEAATDQPASGDATEAEPTSDATASPDETDEDGDLPPEEPGEAQEGRRVLYRMTNEGLVVEVEASSSGRPRSRSSTRADGPSMCA
jgi:hypothetical protein